MPRSPTESDSPSYCSTCDNEKSDRNYVTTSSATESYHNRVNKGRSSKNGKKHGSRRCHRCSDHKSKRKKHCEQCDNESNYLSERNLKTFDRQVERQMGPKRRRARSLERVNEWRENLQSAYNEPPRNAPAETPGKVLPVDSVQDRTAVLYEAKQAPNLQNLNEDVRVVPINSNDTKLVKHATLTRYALFACQVIFAVVGAGSLALFTWMKFDERFRYLLSERFQNVVDRPGDSMQTIYIFVYCMIILSCLLIISAFVGCCGVIRQSVSCLVMVFVFCAMLFFCVLASGVFIFVRRIAISNEIGDTLDFMVSKYNQGPGIITETLDSIQIAFHCCGNSGCGDFRQQALSIPRSCDIECTGCRGRLYDAFSTAFDVLCIAFAGVLIAQILTMVFAMVFICVVTQNAKSAKQLGPAPIFTQKPYTRMSQSPATAQSTLERRPIHPGMATGVVGNLPTRAENNGIPMVEMSNNRTGRQAYPPLKRPPPRPPAPIPQFSTPPNQFHGANQFQPANQAVFFQNSHMGMVPMQNYGVNQNLQFYGSGGNLNMAPPPPPPHGVLQGNVAPPPYAAALQHPIQGQFQPQNRLQFPNQGAAQINSDAPFVQRPIQRTQSNPALLQPSKQTVI